MADAELHGKIGGVYNSSAIIRAATISFAISPSRILDSGNGLVTAGFLENQKITVVDSTLNNANFTIASGGVAAGALTLTSAPTAESAGALITIYLQPAGTAVAGFHSWEITPEADVVESTDFVDAGVKTFVLGGKGWAATAERLWQGDNDIWGGDAVGTPRWVRFFLKYVASPANTDGNRAYYYEGLSYVKTTVVKTDCKDIIRQTFSFQGVGALALITRITAW
jgi:hypothetical protein